MTRRALALALLAATPACGDGENESFLSRDELMDPETCRECHAQHYDEWSGSMHAYAAEDPVFLAMNARGQEETGGALGSLCINCHAPLAVSEGATTDGLNLDEVPQKLKGVTCYFCHNAESVDGTHNNPIRLANDKTMRGSIRDPVESPAHPTAYSELTDGGEFASADLCGSCHDIVLPSPPAPAEVELERTFREWQDSLFGPNVAPEVKLTCNSCHMFPKKRPAAEKEGLDVPQRTVHTHDFAAVDVALTPFPQMGRQRDLIQEFLDTTLRVDICVEELPGAAIARVTLDNVAVGHFWPSGASQDRRAWVELRAFDAAGTELYSSGVVGDSETVTEVGGPDLWIFRDTLFGADGQEVHMFWETASLTSTTIPGPVTNDPSDEAFYITHAIREFPSPGSGNVIAGAVDRVTVKVRMRPMGFDVLDDLVGSGHLDRAVRDEMPTFDLVPNRALAEHPQLQDITFEWSQATHDDPRFQRFVDTQGGRRFCCIGMPSQRAGATNPDQPCR